MNQEQLLAQQLDSTTFLTQLAYKAGKKRVHDQTGFIHAHYHGLPEQTSVAIPLYENFLYCLALFRTKTVDNINEAKTKLEHLLAFQSQSQGFFPTYLHEYPYTHDQYYCANYLLVFYGIYRDFHHVLGQALNEKLKNTVQNLLDYFEKYRDERSLPYLLQVKLAASYALFGGAFKNSYWKDLGNERLNMLSEESSCADWMIPSSIAEMMAFLQPVYDHLLTSPWSLFVNQALHCWDSKRAAFVGPMWKEYFYKEEPATTLLDLILGNTFKSYSKRALNDQLLHLQAVLVPSLGIKDCDSKEIIQGITEGHAWQRQKTERFSLSLLEKRQMQNPIVEKGFGSLKLLWGSQDLLHSLVFQSTRPILIAYQQQPNEVVLTYTLNEEVNLEDRDEQKEISFFCSLPKTCLMVENTSTLVFDLSQTLQVISEGMRASIHFSVSDPEARFIGHISQGNRPAQIANKGELRYEAYDWVIALKTLRRSSKCQVQIHLTLHT